MKLHLQNKTLQFIFIVMISTIIAVLLHQIHNDPLMNISSKTQSIVITSGFFPPIAFAALAMTFSIIGLIFLRIQNRLLGSKIQKGMLFGIVMSGIWIIGMTEAHVLFSLSLLGEIYTGFADSCGIFILCLLLGKYFADDTPANKSKPKTRYISILIIATMYIVVRYFSYTILNIESAYITNPFGTFIWTAAMGIWIGIMYVVMDMNIYKKIPFKHALLFGGLVFGLQWILFNLFALLFVVVPVSDLLFRSVFDTIAIILGVYFFSVKKQILNV